MDRGYFGEFILVMIYWNQQNVVMVLWVFQMGVEPNLKVFFCGKVQLFAHFISCYRGMSLTIVDYFVCLGLLIKVLLLFLKIRYKAILGCQWQVPAVTPFQFLWACLQSRHCCSKFNCSIYLSILLSSICSPLLSVSFTPSILLFYLLFAWHQGLSGEVAFSIVQTSSVCAQNTENTHRTTRNCTVKIQSTLQFNYSKIIRKLIVYFTYLIH